MVTKKKTPTPSSMSKKMLKRKKPINQTYFLDVNPITENQQLFFDEWGKEKISLHMVQQVQVKHSLHCT